MLLNDYCSRLIVRHLPLVLSVASCVVCAAVTPPSGNQVEAPPGPPLDAPPFVCRIAAMVRDDHFPDDDEVLALADVYDAYEDAHGVDAVLDHIGTAADNWWDGGTDAFIRDHCGSEKARYN